MAGYESVRVPCDYISEGASAKQSSDRLSTMSRGLKDLVSRFISRNG